MGVATLVIVVILPISMWLLLGHQAYEKQLKVKEDAVLGKVPTASQKPSEKAIECSTMMRSWRRREQKVFTHRDLLPLSCRDPFGVEALGSSLKESPCMHTPEALTP